MKTTEDKALERIAELEAEKGKVSGRILTLQADLDFIIYKLSRLKETHATLRVETAALKGE